MGNVAWAAWGLSQWPSEATASSLGGARPKAQLDAHPGALPRRGLHLDHGANALGPLAHDAHAHDAANRAARRSRQNPCRCPAPQSASGVAVHQHIDRVRAECLRTFDSALHHVQHLDLHVLRQWQAMAHHAQRGDHGRSGART